MFISFSAEIIPSPTSPLADDPNALVPLNMSFCDYLGELAKFWDVIGYLPVKSGDSTGLMKA
jgi:hypothetical protein